LIIKRLDLGFVTPFFKFIPNTEKMDLEQARELIDFIIPVLYEHREELKLN